MRNERVAPAAVLGALLALGIALAGYLLGNALYAARAADRYVTVRGFSEREVRANLAMWPIVFNVTGNTLPGVQADLESGAGKVTGYLERWKFSPDEITRSSPRVTDLQAQGYPGPERPPYRFVAEAAIVLRSADVSSVKQAMEQSGDLVKDGVALLRSYEYNTTFLYTDLEKIKSEMIAEATRDARRAAEQFASDSGSEVGAIRNAQQGYFSVEDRDPFSPEFKKIRVVTTIQYFLDD